ncbi:MAG: hypothetical protein ACREP7_07205, partial [Lysobacter sp.]
MSFDSVGSRSPDTYSPSRICRDSVSTTLSARLIFFLSVCGAMGELKIHPEGSSGANERCAAFRHDHRWPAGEKPSAPSRSIPARPKSGQ